MLPTSRQRSSSISSTSYLTVTLLKPPSSPSVSSPVLGMPPQYPGYEKPHIHGKNFDLFVRTICPSINAHVRKSDLAELVKVLDLRSLVHHGSKSMTARLLGRTKSSLETFIAPQATFGLNSIAALSKCHQLRILDLGLTSESIRLRDLMHLLAQLHNLTTFVFPRCSIKNVDFYPDQIAWPPQLASLTLSGGLDNKFVMRLGTIEGCKLPSSLTELSFTHCTTVFDGPIIILLRSLRDHLTTLHITSMPRLSAGSLNDLLSHLAKLLHLTISLDYMSCDFFYISQPALNYPTVQPPYPLQSLTLVSSGNLPHPREAFNPAVLEAAINEGYLLHLHSVGVAKSCGWNSMDLEEDLINLAERVESLDEENRKLRRGVYAGLSDDEVVQIPSGGIWEFEG
ncbi:hypothetical protein H2199_005449 [Coniosporium tulheliwenetii]|uniref:Uncharacterized protein n=1 Tax=Coniosporium tulheliwenetii TaxID=3383036 RepID=A0ACC2Z1D5_9PEZI|nr:hypothetical protein H2199_005449 [Cladosporium sp. JES 115]